MSRNKNQHFVPQFYLRNFSADGKRRSVNLFNFARARSIFQASIKKQCSRDSWHGAEDIIFERSVEHLEGLCSAIIRKCIHDNELADIRSLKTFVMFQMGRTVFAAEAFAETMKKLHNSAYGYPSNEEELDPKRSIGNHLMHSPILLDLAACLVVNRATTDFITSDNPVVLSNWWFHHNYRLHPGSGVGLCQAGLEIYFPLSPRHQLILYDRNIWSVPKANGAGTVYLHNEGDVEALNERQILNAQHNVYFSSMKTAEHIAKLFQVCISRRKSDKAHVFEFVQSAAHRHKYVRPGSPEAAPRIREKLLITQANEIEPRRRVTLLSKRLKPRFCQHRSIGPLRDLAWLQIVEDFRTHLQQGKLSLTDIDQYAADHPLIHEVGTWKNQFWIFPMEG